MLKVMGDIMLKAGQSFSAFLLVLVSCCLNVEAARAYNPNPFAQGVRDRERIGYISGPVSYPSDEVPSELLVCAENIKTKRMYCTNERTHRDAYKIKVPVGSYYVFATFLCEKNSQDEWQGYRAYYSEFVKCGSHVKCPSHKPIVVIVRAGQTVNGINPGDWYNY